jgi:hypothetical protein
LLFIVLFPIYAKQQSDVVCAVQRECKNTSVK